MRFEDFALYASAPGARSETWQSHLAPVAHRVHPRSSRTGEV
jgi:hypothetical protein